MKNLFKNFLYNGKEFLKYIAKLGFKELFMEVIIILLLLILASFVFVPINMLADIVRNFINAFASFNSTASLLFTWVFNVIATICAVFAFVYFFNNRYNFKDEKVVPIKGEFTFFREDNIDTKKEVKKDVKKDTKVNKGISEDLELPVEKKKEEK